MVQTDYRGKDTVLATFMPASVRIYAVQTVMKLQCICNMVWYIACSTAVMELVISLMCFSVCWMYSVNVLGYKCLFTLFLFLIFGAAICANKDVYILPDQCLDIVGRASGRAFGLWILSDRVMMWLSVWSKMYIVCIWSSWCQCLPKPYRLLPHFNPCWFYHFGTSLFRLSWKRGC